MSEQGEKNNLKLWVHSSLQRFFFPPILRTWRNTRPSLVTMVGPGPGPPGWAVLHHVRYQDCGLQVERLYQVREQHMISWHPRHAANTLSYLLNCYQCLSDCQKVKSTWKNSKFAQMVRQFSIKWWIVQFINNWSLQCEKAFSILNWWKIACFWSATINHWNCLVFVLFFIPNYIACKKYISTIPFHLQPNHSLFIKFLLMNPL